MQDVSKQSVSVHVHQVPFRLILGSNRDIARGLHGTLFQINWKKSWIMLDVRIVTGVLCIWACLSVNWRFFISKKCTIKVIDTY